VKTVDNVKTAFVEEADGVHEDMAEQTPQSSAKARLSNAQERKRMRKASQTGCKNLVKISLEVPSPQEPPECLESAPVVQTTVLSQEVSPADERTSKLMMKKVERKARKAREEKEAEEQVSLEVPSPSNNKENSDSEVSTAASTPLSQSMPSVVSTSTMVSGADTAESDGSSDAGNTSQTVKDKECDIKEELLVTCNQTVSEVSHVADEADVLQEPAGPSGDEVQGLDSVIAPINFDDIESDPDSDGDLADPGSMVDASPISNAPIMWCKPGMMDEIEGWVAVAVPAECAPPGAFDGLWKNGAGEKILIEKLEIMFESGVAWDMEMHSMTSLSVKVGGQQFDAEFDNSAKELLWSDGDVWTFFGLAQTDCAPEAVPELPCGMMPAGTENLSVPEMEGPMFPTIQEWTESGSILPTVWADVPMDPAEWTEVVPMFPSIQEWAEEVPMFPAVQCMPANGEKWETCWDWDKKGWCPRGMDCEWYHPAPEPVECQWAEPSFF